jgi:hypothetical protein
VRSGVGQKRDESILNPKLISHTRGEQSTNIPTLQIRDPVPIFLSTRTSYRTRTYTVIFLKPQINKAHHLDYWPNWSKETLRTRKRVTSRPYRTHTSSPCSDYPGLTSMLHTHTSYNCGLTRSTTTSDCTSWRSPDAHLLKAATPAANMGNRTGGECQQATALEASVQ